ncbi:MAG: N-acyl homoserine lactonase family protein [bacterium]|nr:N-acyl homoserine lactonase family protein [bacterium]
MRALRTGLMDVKHRYYEAKGRTRAARLTSVLLDRQWTQIPVFVWVIEHPEGVIVIDAGETAKVNEPDFFPAPQRPYWRSQYRFHITPENEAGAQLRRLNIPPQEVRWVVLTHAHFDHTDALYHFPNAEFIISSKEFDDAYRYRSAHFAFPSKWPDWFKPHIIDYVPERIGPFEQSYVLTKAGDVRIVPTPGHTLGHQSVMVQQDGYTFFFGGDTSFDLPSLLNDKLDAPSFDSNKVFQTRQKILDYAHDVPLVYLTTHDPETAIRLEQRTPIYAQAQPVRT